jgi:hypothetical protein
MVILDAEGREVSLSTAIEADAECSGAFGVHIR